MNSDFGSEEWKDEPWRNGTPVQKWSFQDKIRYSEHMLSKATDDAQRGSALFSRGMVSDEAGLLAEAMVYYQRALAFQAKDPRARGVTYAYIAGCLNKLGQYAEADATARRGLSLIGDAPVLHTELAISLEKRGLLREAAKEYVEALMTGPRNDLHMKEVRRFHSEHPGVLESDSDLWTVASIWLALDEPAKPWNAGDSSQRFRFCLDP